MSKDLVKCPPGTSLVRVPGKPGWTSPNDDAFRRKCRRENRSAQSRQEALACQVWRMEKSAKQLCEKPDGTLHGPAVSISQEGKIWLVGGHRNAKLHGKLTEYHPNGKKASEVRLVDGVRCGRYVSWSGDGKVIDTASFEGEVCEEPKDERGKGARRR